MFPAEGHSLLGHKLPKRGRSCEACKCLKVGCSGHAPCTRCWRLALRCVPQGQGGGERGDDGCGGSGGDVDEDEKLVAKNSGTAAPSAAGLAALFPRPPPGRLMRQVIERLDPRPIAELVAQVFIDRYREGLVVRDSAVLILRHWAWKNTLCGGFDASWGALGTIMKEMRLSSADVEEPEAPVCASNQGVGRAEAQMMAAHALIPAMQQTAPFQEAERHNAAVLMMAPWGGRLLEASNGLFRESFRGVREIYSDMIAASTLSELLLCALIAPEDRALFVGALLDVQLTRGAQRVQQIVKTYNTSTGDVELHILEARPLQTLPDGSPLGLLLRLERCPPSKYLSACRLLSVVKTFRTMERPLSPPPSPTMVSPPKSPPVSCCTQQGPLAGGASEEESRDNEEGSDEEGDETLEVDAKAAATSNWATITLPGTASMALNEQMPAQSELRALLVARLPRESLDIFNRRHPCLPAGPDGSLLPPAPLPAGKRQPSDFEWTRCVAAPPAPVLALLTPPLQLEVAAKAHPTLRGQEQRGGIGGGTEDGSWGQRAWLTPGIPQVGCGWAEGHEPPIFDDELLSALFD